MSLRIRLLAAGLPARTCRSTAGSIPALQEALGDPRRIVHVGGHGAGYTVKLLVNLLWFGQAVASAEALAIATRGGLDPQVFRSAVQQSAACGRFMDESAGALLAGDDMTSFSLAGCHRELAEVVELAQEYGVPVDLSEMVRDLYAQALAHYGDVDGELLAARLVFDRSARQRDRRPSVGG